MDQGFTWLKMDLGYDLVEKHARRTVSHPIGVTVEETARTQHMFTGVELTDKGIAMMADYVGRSSARSWAWSSRFRPTTSATSA